MREPERGVRSFKGECCLDAIGGELESSDMIGLELTTAQALYLLLMLYTIYWYIVVYVIYYILVHSSICYILYIGT